MADQHNKGHDNLIPMNKRTPEEMRAIASKGGIKSGEVRRERATLRKHLLALLSDGKLQEEIVLALIDKAKNGDVRAFEVLRDTVGEKPTDKVEQTNTNVDLSHLSTDEIKGLLNEQ